jgi:hypothetical protein
VLFQELAIDEPRVFRRRSIVAHQVCDLQMPPVCFLVTDGGHDPRRLSGFEDDHGPVRVRSPEVRLDKFIAAALWRLDDRSVSLIGLFLNPDLKPVSGTSQHVSKNPMTLSGC